jgi:hypothetical protein
MKFHLREDGTRGVASKDSQGNESNSTDLNSSINGFKPLSSKTVREIAYIVGNYHYIKNIQST